EDAVADRMPERIVDRLEVVEVDEQQREHRALVARGALQPRFERAPVVEAGERILHGDALPALGQARELDTMLALRRHQPRGFVVARGVHGTRRLQGCERAPGIAELFAGPADPVVGFLALARRTAAVEQLE